MLLAGFRHVSPSPVVIRPSSIQDVESDVVGAIQGGCFGDLGRTHPAQPGTRRQLTHLFLRHFVIHC